MRTIRCHVDAPLAVGADVPLDEHASGHLVRVLRLGVGDALVLFNGDGHDYAARLVSVEKRGARVPIPEDVVVANELSPLARANRVPVDEVAPDDMILDVGPKTAAKLSMMLAHAGTIVWNGPLGVFEIDQFGGGTKMIAAAIAHSPAFSIAGGGDTLAAIAKYGIENQVDYISTGGGAFLEFLEGKTLPAFAVLAERAKD